VAALLAGLPSMTYYYFTMPSVDTWLNRYLYNSMSAAGNVILPEHKHSDQALMLAGVVAHFAISLSWGVALSYATRNIREPIPTILACAVLAMLIHYFDLLVVPKFWSMPRLNEFINETGHVSHLFDHISFGVTSGSMLAGIRSGKFRDWYQQYVEQPNRVD